MNMQERLGIWVISIIRLERNIGGGDLNSFYKRYFQIFIERIREYYVSNVFRATIADDGIGIYEKTRISRYEHKS